MCNHGHDGLVFISVYPPQTRNRCALNEAKFSLTCAEIAFYKGNKKEEQVIKRVFQKLIGTTRRSERFRHSLGVLDSVVAKYFATIVGWTVVSRPFLNRSHPRHATSTSAEVYQGALGGQRDFVLLGYRVRRNVGWAEDASVLEKYKYRIALLL